MDSLRSRINEEHWFKKTIIPLSFFGFGSIESILNLKLYEIHELSACIKDDNVVKQYKYLHGIPIK